MKAEQYIKDKALESCRLLILVDRLFEEYGLELTQDDLNELSSTVDEYWAMAGSTFEDFGIAKSSYERANPMLSMKMSKIFDYLYQKGGEKAVSDEDLQEYFTENYTRVDIMEVPYTYQNDEGNTDTYSDEEIATIKELFDGYRDEVKDGATMAEVAKKYQDKEDLESSPLNEFTVVLDDMSTWPSDLVSAIKSSGSNAPFTLEASDAYYLVDKYPIADSLSYLDDEEQYMDVVYSMKSEEFYEQLNSDADEVEIEINQSVVNKYQPSRFGK